MKKTLVIYGAGAIGRGFMPWVYPPPRYEYYFVDSDVALVSKLNDSLHYTTHKTREGGYEPLLVPVKGCFALGEETRVLGLADAIITAVGPRNVLSLKNSLANVRVPVICCENDSAVPAFMTAATGNPNFFFAIPDVITSSTAPPELLKKDPLCLVTEDGVCFADARAGQLEGNCKYVNQEELEKQWLAKLYLHNTPHCIAAYLGALLGVKFLHEAVQSSAVQGIVFRAMSEMETMLERKFQLEASFLRWYAGKEMKRFRNTLLYDPIMRVAREPFRKLALNNRLIGAAQMCLSAGVAIPNILLGIMAAFCYDNHRDPDHNITYLRNALEPYDFLRIIIKLRPGEALFEMLLNAWTANLETLRKLKA